MMMICAGSVGFVTIGADPYRGPGGNARQVMACYRVVLGARTAYEPILNP